MSRGLWAIIKNGKLRHMTTENQDLYASEKYETQLAPSIDKATVESPDQNRPSNSSYQEERLTAKKLKEQISFIRLLERDRHIIVSAGKGKKCLCPFHDEHTASFYIREDDSSAKCYGCGWYGDIFNYVMDKDDVDFSEAFKRLEKKVPSIKRLSPCVVATRAKSGADSLKPEQIVIQKQASKRLAEDERLCASVASKRGWKPETIQKLAKEGALGWNQGALAFLYDTGMKLRNWPHHTFVWEFGGCCVWRRKRIAEATEIIICEGETDAISLIDKGLEDDPVFAVVALASATMITGDLVGLVTGKNVTLCMDNDNAGQQATDKLVELLEPVCASVKTFNFGEVEQ
jgi:5S rRNA maturation endonuclease (ribonuclease M5)